jgi:4-oxalocrotonate tautomerase
MPYLNLRLSDSPPPEVLDRAIGLLTDLTVDVLGKKRELVSLAIDAAPQHTWAIGGRRLSTARTFYLEIKVTEGTNTKREKAEYLARVWSGLGEILGEIDSASYIVIHEVRADAWGYEGRTQEYRHVRSLAT